MTEVKVQKTLKTIKTAQKSVWIAGILTFFLPFAGYLYTARRWIALVVFLLWLPLFAAGSETDATSDASAGALAILMLATTVENVYAIFRARGRCEEIGLEIQQQEGINDLRITLLKLAQQNGQITVADCVIQTGKNVDDVRSMLSELERQDLLRSSNRDNDGAVVYSVV